MTVRLAILLSLASSALLHAAAATTAPAARRPGYSDRYGVLSEHNIFLRDRSKPTTRRTTEPARRTPEESFVLTGIVAEYEGIRAYFEQVDGGPGVKLFIGDALARGKVSGIAMDAIEYESADGRRTWVEIGCNLTGRAVTLATPAAPESASASSSAPSTAPSGAAAKVDANDPNLSMEQRLRLRRLQELNRR